MTLTFQELAVNMLKFEQIRGQTIYQHGMSVKTHFDALIGDFDTNDWRIPTWFTDYKNQLLVNLWDEEITSLYLVYHDCGKPYCREEIDGKVHFPNHAEVSKRTFLEAGGNPIAANLIGLDMVLHTASSEMIEQYLKEWDIRDACTLLLAALSELHSNAKMFGGISSISFKSKWKTIDRRGRQICKHYFGDKK
jgi:hypothetical protein